MSCASDHAYEAFLAVGLGHCAVELGEQQRITPAPLISGALATLFASLPDLVEPAIHSHHRKFFHSIAFASLLVTGGHYLYRWKPEEPLKQVARYVILIAGASYLVHLAMDAGTPRSIPLVGSFS